jgi:hypothetical protein
MFSFGKGKVNPKYCPNCNGSGSIVYFETPTAPIGKVLTGPDTVRKEACPKCRGTGLMGVPGIENISSEKLNKLIEGKTSDELMVLFKGKTSTEVEAIFKKL